MSFRLCIFLIFLGMITWGRSTAHAQLENQVKAALLVSFTTMVSWSTPPASFSIGIVGDDPFGPNLENVAKLKNVAIKKFPDAASVSGVDILYVNPARNGSLAQIVESARPGTLIVGEGDTFIAGGGMISFVLRDGKVRFMINGAAAESKGLKISPRLDSLKVAS